jgi:hypothetical protein
VLSNATVHNPFDPHAPKLLDARTSLGYSCSLMKTASMVLITLSAVALAGCSSLKTHEDYSGESICVVHAGLTRIGTVPIIRKSVSRPAGYDYARKTAFPNSNALYVGPDLPSYRTEARIRYCEKCREAEAAWMKQNAGR